MNAVLLAGDRIGTRPLCNSNKAFLPLEGWPLFIYVLDALSQAEAVEKIWVIGSQRPLMSIIEKALPVFLFSKKIEVIQQRETLIENIQYAYDCVWGRLPRRIIFTPRSL